MHVIKKQFPAIETEGKLWVTTEWLTVLDFIITYLKRINISCFSKQLGLVKSKRFVVI